jgi:hypothetical protein
MARFLTTQTKGRNPMSEPIESRVKNIDTVSKFIEKHGKDQDEIELVVVLRSDGDIDVFHPNHKKVHELHDKQQMVMREPPKPMAWSKLDNSCCFVYLGECYSCS